MDQKTIAAVAERLEKVRRTKTRLLKKLGPIEDEERKLITTLEILNKMVVAAVGVGGTAVDLNAAMPKAEVIQFNSPNYKSLSTLVMEIFAGGGGLTSRDVLTVLEQKTTAKQSSILSTLSRLATKGKLKRVEDKYWLNVNPAEEILDVI